ncbi:superoxide dismutase, Ni [Stieleria sp. JC731]|uniref:superoxide dismutase, Ni n=1 Tax=Pirellulaceae TaxID=2691357 RepID=UPI001E52426E|nr:superoxide dismutase, Ni [Stieleria sp. JC731]MCC9600526.1 superoxide dismutase, Ni [Stieleria sp. JC731]
MTRFLTASLAFMFTASIAMAHCQVPCGIYGDQMRFEQMLEDEHTISKAQLEINKIADGELGKGQAINQAARWVATKEDHATKIQNTIAAYFMAQRIKADGDNYTKKLTSAHAVMVAAMKCKQSADPATAQALEKAIFDFYRAYEGKEPDFEHSH